jgi:hypothetical protein
MLIAAIPLSLVALILLGAFFRHRMDRAKAPPVRLAKMESWQHTESEAFRY